MFVNGNFTADTSTVHKLVGQLQMVNENLIIIQNMSNPVVTESFLFVYDFYLSQLLFCLFHIRFSFRNCEIIELCPFCILVDCLLIN